ncbi:sensor histidine kinase [Flagellimonas nanhaiensis]|nr:histidine kinase [Allomuricauda nanhaiensis]
MNLSFQKIIRYEPLIHIFFWYMVLFFPYVKYLGREGGYPIDFRHELLALLFDIIPTYLAYFWFFPYKKKSIGIPLFIAACIVIAIIYNYFDGYFHPGDQHPQTWKLILSSLVRYASLITAFFALFSIKEMYRKQRVIENISLKQHQAELSILKGQINPHFLFNTLNTIYSSALDKDDKTADLILKLSDNFRYILVEGQQDAVSLKKEIRHLKDYIALQKERLADKVSVDWFEDIEDPDAQIPPLLLISFIENAFKYSGLLKGKNNPITIQLKLNGGKLYFYCENSCKDIRKEEVDENWNESGIGIENTKKRLQLLYPNKHELRINSKSPKFIVELQIQLL